MKKLFVVYNSFPIMVYANSKEEANELAKPIIEASKDIHDSKGILFKEHTKQVKKEEDIPINKKMVFALSSKEDFHITNKLNCIEIFQIRPKICFEHCDSSGFAFSRTIGNRTLSIVRDGSKYTLYDGRISPVARSLGIFDDYEDAAFAAEDIFRKDFEELQRIFI